MTAVQNGTAVTRTAFANNVVPASRMNPIAVNLMKYFPSPNAPGLVNGTQNYAINAVDSDGYDNEMGRLDMNLGTKTASRLTHTITIGAQNKNNFFDNPATGNYLFRINQGAHSTTCTRSAPRCSSTSAPSWARYIENHSAPADGIDPASLGFPSSHRRQLEIPDAALHHVQYQRHQFQRAGSFGGRASRLRTAGIQRRQHQLQRHLPVLRRTW